MTRLLLVPGSQRRESLNARLLRHLAEPLGGRCDIELLEPQDVDLPLFNQDLEADPAVMRRVHSVHQRFQHCHGLIVASPEYNGQLTPYLKNLIDWVSRLAYIDTRFVNPFIDRPVLLCSASSGWSGGALAIPQARSLFGYVGCLVIGDTVCVPNAGQAWTDAGYMFDPFFDEQIQMATERVLRLADDFARAHPSAGTPP